MNGDRHTWNVGDVLHLIQIAMLLVALGVAYEKFQVMAEQVTATGKQLQRVEHYLSSKDSEYWHRSKDE